MKTKNEYRRNHFIPEGYLKNFTDENGKIYVLDKQAKYRSSAIRHVSPKQICYEWDRYVMKFDADTYKGLEYGVYRHFDQKHSKTLKLLQDPNFDWINCPTDTIENLEVLIPMLYWRSPVSDKEFDLKITESKRIEDFGVVATVEGQNEPVIDPDFHKKFLSDENIHKALRPIMAFASFGKSHPVHDQLEWRVSERVAKGSYLASDNPILFYDKPKDYGDFRGEVILPIGNNRTLVRINENNSLDSHHVFFQDMLIFHQAQRYVLCSDKWYLDEVRKGYANFLKTQYKNQLRSLVFDVYHKNHDA